MVKTSKKLRRKLARVRHHKGRAGHSRYPACFADVATLEELRKEMHVCEVEAV